MSDPEVQPAAVPAPEAPGLSQWQRVTNMFMAPSKTFEDIKRGNRNWWLPFAITVLTGAFLYGAITTQVTWRIWRLAGFGWPHDSWRLSH